MKAKNIFVILCLLAFFGAILFIKMIPPRQDYLAYSFQWKNILDGQDPWEQDSSGTLFIDTSTINAYGPLFGVFALLFKVHPNCPRFLWSLFWFSSVFYIIFLLFRSTSCNQNLKYLLPLLFLVSPLFWLQNVYYAKFDIVVAVLVFFSIMFIDRDNNKAAGILLAIAIALKYYPLVFVPILAYSNRKLNRSFLGAVTFSLILIFGCTYLLWGTSFLFALTFASSRSSQYLSLFRFLRSDYSPLNSIWGISNIDFLSTPLLAFSCALFFIIYAYRKLDYRSGIVLIYIITLLLYKVGHEQYHILLHYLLLLWLIRQKRIGLFNWIVLVSYSMFINLFAVAYFMSPSIEWWNILTDTVGILSAFLLILLFVTVFTTANHEMKRNESTS